MEHIDDSIYNSMDAATRRHYSTLVFPQPVYAVLVVADDESSSEQVVAGLQKILEGSCDIHVDRNVVFFSDYENETQMRLIEDYLNSAEGVVYAKLLTCCADFLAGKDLLERVSMFTDYSRTV